MPTGMASATHMTLAQTTTASTDMPSLDNPSGQGSTAKIRKNNSQAAAKPAQTVLGLLPHWVRFSLT